MTMKTEWEPSTWMAVDLCRKTTFFYSVSFIIRQKDIAGFPAEFPFVHFCSSTSKNMACLQGPCPHPLDETRQVEFMLTKKKCFHPHTNHKNELKFKRTINVGSLKLYSGGWHLLAIHIGNRHILSCQLTLAAQVVPGRSAPRWANAFPPPSRAADGGSAPLC